MRKPRVATQSPLLVSSQSTLSSAASNMLAFLLTPPATIGKLREMFQPHATLIALPVTIKRKPARNELLKRLLANTCELCKSTQQVEVYHIRKLADLKKQGQAEKPHWVRVIVVRLRKTLMVCRECHQAIHVGKPARKPREL